MSLNHQRTKSDQGAKILTETFVWEKPNAEDLVEFYARIGEAADHKSLEDMERGGCFYLQAKSNGRLVGLLRGWQPGGIPKGFAPSSPPPRTEPNKKGIVYEVAVEIDSRGRKLSRKLIGQLETFLPSTEWIGNPARVSPRLDRDLNVIRQLYGISLVLGFQNVIKGSYTWVVPEASQEVSIAFTPPQKLLLFVILLVLAATGMRFFWAVGNIRRFVLLGVLDIKPPPTRALVILNLPILFAHATLFFYICCTYLALCQQGFTTNLVFYFSAFYSALLVLNSLWLFGLERARERRAGTPCGAQGMLTRLALLPSAPWRLWMWNNAVFGATTIIWLAFLFSRQTAFDEGHMRVAVAIFATNCLVDLLMVKGAYIFGDAFGGG